MARSPPDEHGFEAYIEASRRCRTRDALFECFQCYMLWHGYDLINVSVMRDPDLIDDELGFGLYSTYPDSWRIQYDEQALSHIDPVLHMARGGAAPFRWKDLERKLILSDRQLRFLGKAEAAGLHHGVGFPLAGPMQCGGVALASSSRVSAPNRNLDLLNAFCQQFCIAYKRLCVVHVSEKTVLAILSDREAEILGLAGRGRTDGEISLALGVRPSTINFHFRNIFRKLNVNNRIDAVVTALTSGQINL